MTVCTFLKTQQRFKSNAQNVFTEKTNKDCLIVNDDKRIQTLDRVISYPYGTHTATVF